MNDSSASQRVEDRFLTRLFLIATWVICAIGTAAVEPAIFPVITHPLAHGFDYGGLLTTFVLPYLLIAGSAWPLRRHFWLLFTLTIAAGLIAFPMTMICYRHAELALALLGGAMACGPPPAIFAIPFGYGVSLTAVLAALGAVIRAAHQPR